MLLDAHARVVLAAFELAAKMERNHQHRFATRLGEMIDEINDAYGGNCSLGVEEVERAAAETKAR